MGSPDSSCPAHGSPMGIRMPLRARGVRTSQAHSQERQLSRHLDDSGSGAAQSLGVRRHVWWRIGMVCRPSSRTSRYIFRGTSRLQCPVRRLATRAAPALASGKATAGDPWDKAGVHRLSPRSPTRLIDFAISSDSWPRPRRARLFGADATNLKPADRHEPRSNRGKLPTHRSRSQPRLRRRPSLGRPLGPHSCR